jgi:cytochrome c2
MSLFRPTGPAGWRQLGLLALLALIAVLLGLRGCGPEPSGAAPMTDAEPELTEFWQPEKWSRDVAALFDVGPVDGHPDWAAAQHRTLGGDPARGRELAEYYGCGACHRAPGAGLLRGTVGPDLAGFADRAYIAGVLTNRPGALVDWLINPPRFAPDTAMPDMGVTAVDARDLAAWLYTLRGA